MYAYRINLIRAGGCCLVMNLNICSDSGSESTEMQNNNTWY